MKKVLINAILILFTSCNLFEKDEQLVQTVNSPDGKVVKLYYVGLGATTNNVLQVRMVNKDSEETLIQAYEHNFVNSARFATKDSLVIILSDTTMYGPSKRLDTIEIIIK